MNETSRYSKLAVQPIILIAKANINYCQGEIIKKITCYKTAEEVYECIDYAEYGKNLMPLRANPLNAGLGYSYCNANNLSNLQTEVITAALRGDYTKVIIKCKKILTKEFGASKWSRGI